MHDLINQVFIAIRGMWKYRRLAMLVSWLVALAGAVVVFQMPDRFEASARLYADTQSILRPIMAGLAVQPDVEQQVAMLTRTLISRPTVEKLIGLSGLDQDPEFKTDRSAFIARVTESVQVRYTGRDNFYTLSFRDEDPETSLRVVQSLLAIFLESNQVGLRTDSESARRFIEEQIKNYETKLVEAETRLKEFRLRHLDTTTAQGGLDMAGRMNEATNALSQARLELREAESAQEAARRQLAEARALLLAMPVEPTSSVALPEMDARIDALKRNLDGLLQRFTEQHPDVLNTRLLIRELEDQRQRQLADLRRAAQAAPMSQAVVASPAVLELTRILSTTEVQVASLRARVAEFESRVGLARVQLNLAPQIEAELAQLNRDYDVHLRNYEELVSRREAVVLSGELDAATGLERFRVVDPPQVASRPVAPNRLLLLPLALLVALGAGLGVAFLMSQFRPAFFEATTLRKVTELPLLGVVNLVQSAAVRRQELRSYVRFSASLASLVMLFLIGMLVLSYLSGV